MPARLKSFEIHGYKTFAARTEFQFADGITAIVGPNGSGKSNIADSIRWVLGEQSYSLLRGKKTEDMIFSGSEQKPRAGMAQATVVFDNDDGWLPIDFSEVAITRRAYRDGDNEYLLNGQRVRLKDVSELLAKSGLAERTYTIIGQGLVDAALALKAEERRRLFEEAAGIGLYRTRREEAIRRLDSTKRNLERVQDILSELQPRLRSLERQAKRAQEYEQIRTDLKILLRDWYGYQWHQAQADFIEAQNVARAEEEALNLVQQAQSRLDENIVELRTKIQSNRDALGDLHKRTAELHQQRESLGRNQAVAKERIRSLQIQIEENESEINNLGESSILLGDRKAAVELELEQSNRDLEYATDQVGLVSEALEFLQSERIIIENQVTETQNLLSQLVGTQAQYQARLAEKQALRERQREALKIAQDNLASAERELEENSAEVISTQARLVELEKLQKAKSEVLTVLQKQQKESDGLVRRLRDEHSTLESRYERMRTQVEIIEDAERKMAGYADGAQILLSSLGLIKANGILGAVGGQMVVPANLEHAITAALGEYVDAVIYRDSIGVDGGLDLLKAKTVKGAILALDNVNPPKMIALDLEKVPGGKESVLGVAAELVSYAAEYKNVVELLLGQVIVVSDRAAARNLLTSSNWQQLPNLRIVTLEGELFAVGGLITSGSASRGILSRPRQIREMKAEQNSLAERVHEAKGNLDDAQGNLLSLTDQMNDANLDFEQFQQKYRSAHEEVRKLELNRENLQKNFAWLGVQKKRLEAEIRGDIDEEKQLQAEFEQYSGKIDSARENHRQKLMELEEKNMDEVLAQLSYWKTRAAVGEQAANDIKRRLADRMADIDRLNNDIATLQMRLDGNRAELVSIELAQEQQQIDDVRISADIVELHAQIEPIETELLRNDSEQNQLLSVDLEERQRFRNAEHSHAQAKIKLARREESLGTLRRRVEDDFGLVSFEYADTVTGPKPLPLEGLVEELPHVIELSMDIEDAIQRQRAQLKRIGPINLEARIEYHEVKDRFEFMNEQVTDLHKAEKDILEVIAELDLLMQREFRRTFEAVAQEFRTIFTRLFNGGVARLVLTEPDNISETGIEIEARLPGRREQGLLLLSGGERSLTAVALVFALLKISPTPFCILDEVDAMLDEANVGRFREMLTELSDNTQFIVITHNRNTVQAADVIYGVTMGRDSTSQVISLKLDEVSEEFGV